jgi:carbonic anhydrase/acetyltransferase-like protein (isoleucine patch superfamily)
MSRPLIFVGSRHVMGELAIIAELRGIEIMGILDHHYYGNTTEISRVPVIGDERWLLDPTNNQAQEWLKTCDFFPANVWDGVQWTPLSGNIDLQKLRQNRIEILEKSGANCINLIHPNAIVFGLDSKYSTLTLGKGILMHAGSRASITNVSIGDFCIIMEDSFLGHDTLLGKNVIVAAASCLHSCDVGDNGYIGQFSKIDPIACARKKEKIKIGTNSTVWSNSLIIKDVPDNSIYTYTNRILKKIKAHD